MIAIIRIKGEVGINKRVEETLSRLRLRKKYSCVVINPDREQIGMLKKIRDFVAFGEISDEMFEKLVESRGKVIDKKKSIDPKKVVEGIKSGKRYEELNVKPFFRLHPPRKGIKSKVHFPKGVLGDHKKKINDLVERML